MQVIETPSTLLTLSFHDWEGTRRAEVDGLPASATIGEALTEAVRALGLPLQTFYQAFRGDRRLNETETIQEAGVEAGDQLRILPDVSAG